MFDSFLPIIIVFLFFMFCVAAMVCIVSNRNYPRNPGLWPWFWAACAILALYFLHKEADVAITESWKLAAGYILIGVLYVPIEFLAMARRSKNKLIEQFQSALKTKVRLKDKNEIAVLIEKGLIVETDDVPVSVNLQDTLTIWSAERINEFIQANDGAFKIVWTEDGGGRAVLRLHDTTSISLHTVSWLLLWPLYLGALLVNDALRTIITCAYELSTSVLNKVLERLFTIPLK